MFSQECNTVFTPMTPELEQRSIGNQSLSVNREREGSHTCVILLISALRYNENRSQGVVLFPLEHCYHSNRDLAICHWLSEHIQVVKCPVIFTVCRC